MVEELIDVRKLVSSESGQAILVAGLDIGYLACGVLNAGLGVDVQAVVGPSEFGVIRWAYEADRVETLPDEVGEWVGLFLALWRVQLVNGYVGE